MRGTLLTSVLVSGTYIAEFSFHGSTVQAQLFKALKWMGSNMVLLVLFAPSHHACVCLQYCFDIQDCDACGSVPLFWMKQTICQGSQLKPAVPLRFFGFCAICFDCLPCEAVLHFGVKQEQHAAPPLKPMEDSNSLKPESLSVSTTGNLFSGSKQASQLFSRLRVVL